jgi:hypothetical protein
VYFSLSNEIPNKFPNKPELVSDGSGAGDSLL